MNPSLPLSLALAVSLLLSAAPASADATDCRSRIARVAGSLAAKRAKLISRCEDSSRCDRAQLAAKLANLDEVSRRKLASRCANLSNTDLGLGATCPDPSGRCTQALDSDQAIMDCVLCMVRETMDPMLRRLRGEHSDLAETCGGCSATSCEDEFFCETRRGHCKDDTSVGVCLEVPSACPEILDPVCGCDGETYQNNCMRQQASVGLFHEGPCVTFCEGTSGATCPEGTTCAALPGHCDDTFDEGICVPIPTDCMGDDHPLCGCDGVTYVNECALLEAGVRLAHFGRCEGPGCTNATDCATDQMCERPPEVCDRPDGGGECVLRPGACTDEWEPVCGCDGVTYGNNCERRAAGVPLLHRGECRNLCAGLIGAPCEAGEFCELPPGECEVADLQGHCETLPEMCLQLFDPVCGCNGQTYSNNCERQMAGVQLGHHGPCFRGCTPGDPATCGAEEICLTPPGHCDAAEDGRCVPRPPDCSVDPLLVEIGPVCGCDGVTYDSLCELLLAGVALADDGPCGATTEGCTSNAQCDEGLICVHPAGSCSFEQQPGHCDEIPLECPAVTVCGCDGVTYDSPCQALRGTGGIVDEGPCA